MLEKKTINKWFLSMIGLTNFNFFLFLNHLNGRKTIKFSDTKIIEIDINGPRFRVFEDKLKKQKKNMYYIRLR